MSRRSLLTAVLTLAALPAAAADLPSRRFAPAPPPLPPVFTWTGAYGGINAGYAFEGDTNATYFANDPVSAAGIGGGFLPASIATRTEGFTGGGQIGYNQQLGPQFGQQFGLGALGLNGGVVVGIEADAVYTDLRRTGAFVDPTGVFTTTDRSRIEFVGTVRGRLGYAIDRFLIFGTGGFAYGGVRNDTNAFGAGFGPIYTGGQDKLRTGYAYGGGVEYALATNSVLNLFHSSAVTLKGEFIHFDLGTNSYAVPGVGAAAGSLITARVRTTGDLVRAGLNFKLGPVAAPVVARY